MLCKEMGNLRAVQQTRFLLVKGQGVWGGGGGTGKVREDKCGEMGGNERKIGGTFQKPVFLSPER